MSVNVACIWKCAKWSSVLWGFIPLYACLFMWWNVHPSWDLSAWQPWFKLSLPCIKGNECFKSHWHPICIQACFQCNLQTIISHLYLESAVTLLCPQFHPVNLADGASLLFGNCTMAGSKGWPKRVGWFGWLSCCVSSRTAINIQGLCLGLGQERAQVSCPGLVFPESSLGSVVVYHWGTWSCSSFVSCFCYWIKWWICSACYVFGLSCSASFSTLVSINGCIWLLSQSCYEERLAKQ